MIIYYKLTLLTLVLSFHQQGHAIIGGHEAVPHSRPYMVLLQMNSAAGHIGHCAGFLLNEDFVMTAAHCQAESYKVFLGLHNYHDQNGVQHVNVPGRNAFTMKGYDPVDFRNDMMLLKLSTKAELNDKVKPIGLAHRDDGSLPKTCVISGWGSTENSKYPSAKLLEVNVILTDNELCANTNKYCSEGERGPGQGDAGGPLVCEDGKAYGMISASKINPDRSTIKSYTKIPDHIDFITEHNGNLHSPTTDTVTIIPVSKEHNFCVRDAD
ncbi:mast cell protease 1A-like isoform X3 [Simochromis diagramma]|uniref:mast cell protease 1A-like isoform X3 n=1 Tax=Simochromis diagramma TaxID=43689 RepID=UPI001A7E3C1F|nr:mast cell protease 1A-like isoform X3 [Simochromis diagramma]